MSIRRKLSYLLLFALIGFSLASLYAPQPAYSASSTVTGSSSSLTVTAASNVTVTSTETTTAVSTSTSNMTIVSTVTTSEFTPSDLTTMSLAIVAVAALVIAVYSLWKMRKRPPVQTPPNAPGPIAQGVVCPSCGTANKPNATFCRRCQRKLR